MTRFSRSATGRRRWPWPRSWRGSSPDIARLEKALIATLSNMKRYDETIVQAARYIDRHGEDLTMLDALKVAYFYTGKVDEAVRYGQRALDLRDAEACRMPPPCPHRAGRAAFGTRRHFVFAVGNRRRFTATAP